MLNSRRAVIAAVAILTVFILVTLHHNSGAQGSKTPVDTSKSNGDAAAAGTSALGHELNEKPAAHRPVAQKPLMDMSHMSTYDKLAYAYPYDLETKFPAFIWQTWKKTPADKNFEFRDQESSWSGQHPGFIHEVITDDVAVSLLRLLYATVPEVLEAYNALPLPVLKADFFRYLILFARGGIYSDIDTYAIKSALEWIPEDIPRETVGLVIGIEADPDRPDWAEWYSRRIQFCQWTIQSKPGHPVLRDVITRITNETLSLKRAGKVSHISDKGVVDLTGPAVWTDTIMDYFNDGRFFKLEESGSKIDYHNFTGMQNRRRVGDVVVLPITSFSPGVGQMGAGEPDDPMAFVKHDFEGSWKPESERHIGEQPRVRGSAVGERLREPDRGWEEDWDALNSAFNQPAQSYRQIVSPPVPPSNRSLVHGFQRTSLYDKTRIGADICKGSGPPLFRGTIPDHFSSVVSKHGDRPAVIARAPSAGTSLPLRETVLTYDALDRLSNRLAASLASLGVRKGRRVAISLGNGHEFAALTYALFKLGAVLVPLNPSFNAQQVRAALNHLDADVLITGAVTDLAYRPGRGRSNEPLLREVVGDLAASSVQSEAVPSLRKVIIVDNRDSHPEVRFGLDSYRSLTPYADLLAGSERPVTPDEPLAPSDTINIQFTSGTTSLPKAAMLSHTSILNNGIFIANRMGLNPTDRIVVPPPLFHCFGSVLGYMASATTGAAILFPSPAFDPVATLRTCVDHDATGLYGVSTMIVAVLESLDAADAAGKEPPRSLRKGIVAGSSVPEALMSRIYDRLGLADVVICYGMTETSPVSCMTTPSDPLSKRTSSVGTPMPHTTVKIVSPTDRGVVLPLNTRGELAASGYLVMKGYYGDETRTAAERPVEADGTVWMYSGDEAEMDADGYVRITGRIKDLIIRGGENIHPLEVENCLFQLTGVKEVSVVGVDDERLGESVAAFIIPQKGWSGEDSPSNKEAGEQDHILTRDAVRDWVREKLSGHLVPKHVFWVGEYPKTASGKIQKFKLREMAHKILGQSKENST
ncbi:Acyl-CoA ligase SID4 [Paramyrothecium foliicola]|nr:Acyl-CoA ligase SID4 [Paramyrothecium foliicola]